MDLCEASQVALEAIRNKALEQQEAGPRFGDSQRVGHVYRLRSFRYQVIYYLDVPGRKLVYKWLGSMGYNPNIPYLYK